MTQRKRKRGKARGITAGATSGANRGDSAAGRCEAHNAAGEPCLMHPLTDSRFCWAHDPKRAADRIAARKKGGHNTRTPAGSGAAGREPVDLRSVSSIQALLEETVVDTRVQKNSSQRSRTMGYLLNVAANLLKLSELGELQERIAALEQRWTMKRA